MQALRDRLSSKLGDKSKSKDKEKDGSHVLKSSSSVDGKSSTVSDSQASASASASSSSSIGVQSAEKGSSSLFIISIQCQRIVRETSVFHRCVFSFSSPPFSLLNFDI